jgi:hypothetical protein
LAQNSTWRLLHLQVVGLANPAAGQNIRLSPLPVKDGEVVARKREPGNELWRVKAIRKGIATLERAVEGNSPPAEISVEVPVAELVVVRSFGDWRRRRGASTRPLDQTTTCMRSGAVRN